MTRPADPHAAQIVQLCSLGDDFDARLANRFRVAQVWHADRSGPDAVADLHKAEIAVTSVRRGFKAEDFDSLPALRAICSWGVGYDTLDMAGAARRSIAVANSPGVLDDCVADLAWALLLAAARRITVADRYVKSGQWRAIGEFPLATKVSGKRLGILGLGRIGRAIARRGTGFDMDVRYCSRSVVSGVPYRHEASIAALAEWADFLVLACPGGAATRHMVDAEVLRLLGPRGVLVNIARGSVVDEAALVHALGDGLLGAAGLDVLEREPAVPQEFLTSDRVVLTPHIGSATHDTRAAMTDLVFDNVVAFAETGKLRNPILLS